MTTPAWPASLPGAFLAGTHKPVPVKNRDEFQPDYGPALYGRHYTGRWKAVTGDMILTSVELDDLDDFYEDDLASGSLDFTMHNAITGNVTKTMRFAAPFEPQDASNANEYRVSLSFFMLV